MHGDGSRGGQEWPSIAFSLPGAVEYVAADFTMAGPRNRSAACPSLSFALSLFFALPAIRAQCHRRSKIKSTITIRKRITSKIKIKSRTGSLLPSPERGGIIEPGA